MMSPQAIAELNAVILDIRTEARRNRLTARATLTIGHHDALIADAICLEHWAARIQRVMDDETMPATTPPPKRPITADVSFGKYLVELCGDNAKVWAGEGLPTYEGGIDGIERTYPDLWQHLIARRFIKPA